MKALLVLCSFFAAASFIFHNAYASGLNGIAISNRYVYGVNNNSIQRRTCNDYILYEILSLKDNSINIKLDENENISSYTTKMASYIESDDTYKGIDVTKIHIDKFPWATSKPSTLDILIPKDTSTEIYLDNSAICPAAGWEPESIMLLIQPSGRGKLDYWLASHNSFIEEPDPENPKNFFWLNVPSGLEDKLLTDLLSRDWVLDARRVGMGAGPESATLSFPLHSILTGNTSQMQVRDDITSALKTTFGTYIGDYDVKAVRGYKYSVYFSGPAKDLVKKSKYKNRWLEADTRIYVTTNGTVDGQLSDWIVISILEGFLPVWRDGQTAPPPKDHKDEFTLRSDDQDDMKNYQVLDDLQSLIAKSLAEKFGGEVEFDPNEH